MADLAHATEGDTDLHGDPDAAHWAERFAAKFALSRRPADFWAAMAFDAQEAAVDTEGTMLAWFAAAIETGRTAAGKAAGH
jgi:hypothetical protein